MAALIVDLASGLMLALALDLVPSGTCLAICAPRRDWLFLLLLLR